MKKKKSHLGQPKTIERLPPFNLNSVAPKPKRRKWSTASSLSVVTSLCTKCPFKHQKSLKIIHIVFRKTGNRLDLIVIVPEHTSIPFLRTRPWLWKYKTER